MLKKLYFSFSAHLSIKGSGLDFQKCAHWKEQDIVVLVALVAECQPAPDTPGGALKVGHLIRFPCPRMKIHFPEMHINIRTPELNATETPHSTTLRIVVSPQNV